MRVRIIRCDGYRLRVTTWGSGPPHAVVLPGLSADARSLAPQIRTLRDLYGSVHVIDLPGSVLRPALLTRDAKFANLARYVGRTCDELGIERAAFLGHSLGGGVALHLALDRRELVDALMLVAPAALGRSLHWIYKLYCIPLIGRALLRPQPRVSKPFVRRFLVGSRKRDDDHFVSLVTRHGSSSLERALTARAIVWANQPSWWRRLLIVLVPGGEQIGFTVGDRVAELADVPTLLLWGSEDRVICARDAMRLGRANPGAEIHVVRGVGHSLPLEVPAWANARIRAFAASLRSPERRAA